MHLATFLIGKCNEQTPSTQSIEVVSNPSFHELLVLRIRSFSSRIQCLNEFVNVMVFVEVVPKRFSVVRIRSSMEPLFTSVVKKWDSSGRQSKRQCTFEFHNTARLAQESGIIMVIYE
jgi:hypothetical protein